MATGGRNSNESTYNLIMQSMGTKVVITKEEFRKQFISWYWHTDRWFNDTLRSAVGITPFSLADTFYDKHKTRFTIRRKV